MASATAPDANTSQSGNRGTVKRRLTWAEVTPFPGNTIYESRIENMLREWGGYRDELVGSPVVFDNKSGAFPEYSPETLLVGDGCHRRELALREGRENAEFLADLHRGLSREEMHHRRRGLNDRRTVKSAETFLEKAHDGSHSAEKALLLEIEGLGWRIAPTFEAHVLACTNELTWIRKQSRAAMAQAVVSYEAAYGTKYRPRMGRVIKALGAFWIKHPDADKDRLAAALKKTDVDELYEAGTDSYRAMPFIRQSFDGLRYVIVQCYNRERRGGKLV